MLGIQTPYRRRRGQSIEGTDESSPEQKKSSRICFPRYNKNMLILVTSRWTPSPRRRPGEDYNGHGPTGAMDFVRQELNRFGRGQGEPNLQTG